MTSCDKQPANGMYRLHQQATFLLEIFPFSVLVIDAQRKVLYENASARQLLAKRGLLTLFDGVLSINAPSKREQLRQLMVQALTGAKVNITAASGSLLIADPIARGYLELHMAPLGAAKCLCEFCLQNPLALVLVKVFLAAPNMDRACLVALYQLTVMESKIVEFVAQGLSIEEISLRAHTTLNTVRSHLKNIFRKAHTNNQSALVSRLLSSVAVFSGIAPGR